jgi:hypothetical protein
MLVLKTDSFRKDCDRLGARLSRSSKVPGIDDLMIPKRDPRQRVRMPRLDMRHISVAGRRFVVRDFTAP